MPTARELLEQADALMRRNRSGLEPGGVVHASRMPAARRDREDAAKDGPIASQAPPPVTAVHASPMPSATTGSQAHGEGSAPESEPARAHADEPPAPVRRPSAWDVVHASAMPGATGSLPDAPPREALAPALSAPEDDDAFPVLVDAVEAPSSGAALASAPAADEDVPVLTEAVEEIEAPPLADTGFEDETSDWLTRPPDAADQPVGARDEARGEEVGPVDEPASRAPRRVVDPFDLALGIEVADEIEAELAAQVAPTTVAGSLARPVPDRAGPDAEVREAGGDGEDERTFAIDDGYDPLGLTAFPDLPYGSDEDVPPAPVDAPASAPVLPAETGAESGAPAAVALHPGDRDDAQWNALAEEIRMQVLQRIDIFTETGLRARLSERLKPVVDRASAELVATLNEQVGAILRAYVAEAIEREIERWRGGNP